MKHLNLSLIAAGITLFISGQSAYAITPEEVLKAVDTIRAPGDNFSFDLHVKQKDAEEEKNFDFNVKVKDNEKSLVTYTAPETSKGKRLLMVGENLWIYIPNTRMPIRISPQQKVSAGVSNADVARVVYNLDYQAETLQPEKVDNVDGYHLSLKAKTKGAAYQRIELWTNASDYRPLKADFYASEQKLKTIIYKDYKEVLGKFRPHELEVQDALNSSEQISMQYSNIQLADTPDMHFQTNYLSRLQ